MIFFPNNAKRKLDTGEVALGFGVHHLRSVAHRCSRPRPATTTC